VYVNSGIEQNGGTASNNGGECRRAARKLFELAGVLTRQYVAQGRDHIRLRLTFNNNEHARVFDHDAKGDIGECYSDSHLCGIEKGPKNDSTQQNRINLDDEKNRRDILILEKEANYKVNLSELVTPKRQSYLSWDDYFMCVAYLSAQRSKDPNTQVGACIVNAMKRIAGVGYNGFPQGCSDDILPWNRSTDGGNGEGVETKYLYVCHAEANAILNKGGADIHGATLYVDLFPCNECAKMIIQAGIKEVVYLRDTYHNEDKCRASRIMFQMSGVTYRQHQLSVNQILLDLRKGESSFV
jgi:dCMP deaminase